MNLFIFECNTCYRLVKTQKIRRLAAVTALILRGVNLLLLTFT